MRYTLYALLLLVLLGVMGSFDYASAIDADTAEKEAREASIKVAMAFPLNWTATVEQGGKVRYYVPSRLNK